MNKISKQINQIKMNHIIKSWRESNARRKYNKIQIDKDSNFAYYTGLVSILHPMNDLKAGHTVVTPKGLATVARAAKMTGTVQTRDRWIKVLLKGKHYKEFTVNSIFQYYVYNTQLDLHIMISPQYYCYLLANHEVIEYRMTGTGLAALSPHEVEKRGYIAIFSNKRGGRPILKDLIKKGYKISK
jgi:hypothetical protein